MPSSTRCPSRRTKQSVQPLPPPARRFQVAPIGIRISWGCLKPAPYGQPDPSPVCRTAIRAQTAFCPVRTAAKAIRPALPAIPDNLDRVLPALLHAFSGSPYRCRRGGQIKTARYAGSFSCSRKRRISCGGGAGCGFGCCGGQARRHARRNSRAAAHCAGRQGYRWHPGSGLAAEWWR